LQYIIHLFDNFDYSVIKLASIVDAIKNEEQTHVLVVVFDREALQ